MFATALEWVKTNFKAYFWYFVAFLAGVLACGFGQYLAG